MPTSFESSYIAKQKPRAGSKTVHDMQRPLSGSNRDRRIGFAHSNQADPGVSLRDESCDWMRRVVAGALDALNLAVMATSASGQLLLANRPAQQILRMRDGLQLTPQGTLEMPRPSGRSSLLEIIAGAGSDSLSESCGTTASILVGKRGMGRRPLTLVVQALRNAAPTIDPTAASVLILAIDPERTLGIEEAALRQLHGITAREARLASLLMEGNTLEDCCQDLSIQTSTARMHLGSLFAKTGTQRQGQLVAHLLSSIGVLRTSACVATEPLPDVAAPAFHRADRKSCATAGLEALERLEVGIAFVDDSRTVRFTNVVAQRLMAECTIAEAENSRWLSFLPPRACASRISPHGPWEACYALSRGSEKRPLTVMVRSLSTLSSKDPGVCHLIFILDPQRPLRVPEDGLRQLFGLTPCEARLANLLMEGNSLEACCEQLQIRPSTARMHLSNLFAKTGVQRQGQLVSLLAQTLGMLPVQNISDLRQETRVNPVSPVPWPTAQDHA